MWRRLAVVTKDTVPPFGPPLPNPPIITDMALLRKLLLTKRAPPLAHPGVVGGHALNAGGIHTHAHAHTHTHTVINGETSAYTAPAFRKGMERTTEDMLRRMHKAYVEEVRRGWAYPPPPHTHTHLYCAPRPRC
jgi:hypothetical protein